MEIEIVDLLLLLLWSVERFVVKFACLSIPLHDCHPPFSCSSSVGPDRISVKEDASDGPGGVGRQVGGLRRGPLVPLCAQAQSVDLRREKIVQNEHDRFGTALEVQLNLAIVATEVEPQ